MPNVLILGCGGPAAHNFIDAVNQIDNDYELIGADSSKYMLALSNLENKYLIPPANTEMHIPTILEIIEKEKIDFVHPQPDVEVFAITEYNDSTSYVYSLEDLYRRKIEKTFLPDNYVIRKCQNKIETH